MNDQPDPTNSTPPAPALDIQGEPGATNVPMTVTEAGKQLTDLQDQCDAALANGCPGFSEDAEPGLDTEDGPATKPLEPVGRMFTCHKSVRAAQITRVRAPRSHGVDMMLDDKHAVTVPQTWAARHNPQKGGYYVIYEDGYISYSPQKAFEAGYKPDS